MSNASGKVPAPPVRQEHAIKATHDGLWLIGAIGAISAAITMSGLYFVNNATPPGARVTDVAAIIAIVTFGAVGIERGIEALWGLVANLQNAWWPLNRIHAQITRLETSTNALVKPVFDDAQRLLNEAKKRTDVSEQQKIQDAINWVAARENDLRSERENILKLAADNQRVQLLGNATFQAVAEVERLVARYGADLKATTAMANQAIVGASDLAATFKDNPSRRLLSLGVGTFLGIVLAGVVGLDIFAAINETTVAAPFWGVLATGLVMGLGANPTHEVIRVLQESKKKRQLENLPVPAAGTMAGDVIAAIFGARAESPDDDEQVEEEGVAELIDDHDVLRGILRRAGRDPDVDLSGVMAFRVSDRATRRVTRATPPAPPAAVTIVQLPQSAISTAPATFTLRRN